MSRRILTTLLAVAYAAMVLPGHAGLHALSGTDCQHAEALDYSTPVVAEHSCPFHPDGHHSHDHDADDQQAPTDHHDHGNDRTTECDICQWFAQGQVLVKSVSVEATGSTVCRTVPSIVNPSEKLVFSNADPRGPPVA